MTVERNERNKEGASLDLVMKEGGETLNVLDFQDAEKIVAYFQLDIRENATKKSRREKEERITVMREPKMILPFGCDTIVGGGNAQVSSTPQLPFYLNRIHFPKEVRDTFMLIDIRTQDGPEAGFQSLFVSGSPWLILPSNIDIETLLLPGQRIILIIKNRSPNPKNFSGYGYGTAKIP